MSSYCYSNMYHWCCTCLWQTLVATCMNACPHVNKPELQLLSYILFVAVPWAPGALHRPRSTYKVVQCTNIHHDKCCHPLDKKSPLPVNHGRPSKSNVGDTTEDRCHHESKSRIPITLSMFLELILRMKVLTWDKHRTPVNELSIPGMTNQLIQNRNSRDPVGRLD